LRFFLVYMWGPPRVTSEVRCCSIAAFEGSLFFFLVQCVAGVSGLLGPRCGVDCVRAGLGFLSFLPVPERAIRGRGTKIGPFILVWSPSCAAPTPETATEARDLLSRVKNVSMLVTSQSVERFEIASKDTCRCRLGVPMRGPGPGF